MATCNWKDKLSGLRVFAAASILVSLLGLSLAASSAQAGKIVDRFFPVDGTAGGKGAQFQAPEGIAINRTDIPDSHDGWIYVADMGNRRIQAFSPPASPDEPPKFEWAIGRDVSISETSGDDADSPGFKYERCTDPDDCKESSAGARGGMFSRPDDVAINQETGDIYVRDGDQNNRIQRFDADGNFISAWGWDTIINGSPSDLDGITTFQICSNADHCKAGTPGGGAGQMDLRGGPPTLQAGELAIAPPEAPNAGQVFVADTGRSVGSGGKRVMEFEQNGTFVRAWGSDVAPEGAPGDTPQDWFEVCTTTCQQVPSPVSGTDPDPFLTSNPTHITVDTGGRVYASDFRPGSISPDRIRVFDSTATDAESLRLPSITSADGLIGNVTYAMAVVPTGTVLIARGAADIQEWDPNIGEFIDTHVEGAGLVPGGIEFDAQEGDIWLTSSSLNESRVYTADADGAQGVLDAQLDPPTSVTAHEASFSGSVNPDGFPVDYRFEVSKTGVEGEWHGVSPYRALGAGVLPIQVPIEAADGIATNLEACTLYRVRISAVRGFGNGTVNSPELSFLTDCVPPDVLTDPVISADHSSAYLRGTLSPNGSPSTYWFEYGPTSAYGAIVPVPAATAMGGIAQPVAQRITGLEPDKRYHYRLVASSAYGTSYGEDRTFVTLTNPEIHGDRGYEKVSPDSIGGAGVGAWYQGPGSLAQSAIAAHDGERAISIGVLGSMLLDSGMAWAHDLALSTRTEEGWVSHPATNIPALERPEYRMLGITSPTPDLGKFVLQSNSGSLYVFPEMVGKRYGEAHYVLDWEGNWDLLAPIDPLEQYGDGASSAQISADGRFVLSTREYSSAAGTSDPNMDQNAGHSTYLVDFALPPDNSFSTSRDRARAPLVECTEGTLVPSRLGSGLLAERPCPDIIRGSRQTLFLKNVSGEFSLKLGNEETGVLPAGLDAEQLQAALEALPGIQPSDVKVSGSNGVFFIQFSEAAGNVPTLELDQTGLATHLNSTVGVRYRGWEPSAPTVSTLGSVAGTAGPNAISRDGSRVFFMSPDPDAPGVPVNGCAGAVGGLSTCAPQLYIRQTNSDGTVSTRWISKPVSDLLGNFKADLLGTAIFEGATEDGATVYFRTNSPLTADDPNSGDPDAASLISWDLYRYDLPPGPDGDPATPDADPAEGTLTRISGGPSGEDDPNGVGTNQSFSMLRQMSEDGKIAYFATAAPLDGAAEPIDANRITTPAGSPSSTDFVNLYRYDARAESESYRFIARLSTSGVGGCASRGGNPGGTGLGDRSPAGFIQYSSSSAAGNCTRTNRDGSWFVMWTHAKLTADDPDETTGDVYGYDAENDQLIRLSRPQGGSGESYECAVAHDGQGDIVGRQDCYADLGIAGLPAYGPLVISDNETSGDLVAYFQSRSRLVADDSDLAYDVYEWRNGRLSLVTRGKSGTDGAFYIGNSNDDKNVYFVTRDSYTWQDKDVVGDLYTARIGGGIPQPAEPSVCDVLQGSCETVKSLPSATPALKSSTAREGNIRDSAESPSRSAQCRVLAQRRKRAARRARALAARTKRVGGSRAKVARRQARKARRAAKRAKLMEERCRLRRVGKKARGSR